MTRLGLKHFCPCSPVGEASNWGMFHVAFVVQIIPCPAADGTSVPYFFLPALLA